jgi:hypothetical protein
MRFAEIQASEAGSLTAVSAHLPQMLDADRGSAVLLKQQLCALSDKYSNLQCSSWISNYYGSRIKFWFFADESPWRASLVVQPELFTTAGVWFALRSDSPDAEASFANSAISRRK